MVKVLDRESINRMTRNSGRGGSTYVGSGGGGSYTLPVAADGTLGGVQLGYTTDATARKYAVQLDDQQRAYVNVPWTDHYAWSDITNKPSAAGDGTTPVYWTGSGFAQCTSYANASVNYATSAGNADTVDGYHESAFLHLTGGTMTGTLKVATGYGISDATNNGLLVYHPDDWTGVTSSQWGVGAVDGEGVIRSANNALKHYRYNDGTYEIIDSKGGQTIANSLQIASVKIEQTNEVNSYQGALHLNYRAASDVTACIGGGNFGIGTTSPGYKLHVVGKIYCTGGFAFLSDIRKKNVVGFCNGFSVKDIANAPLIQYTLKGDLDDGRRHIGSVAQYWQKVLPDTVNEADGTLSMDQESILMASVITLARKVMSLENQIIQLKVKGYGKQ